MNNNKAQVIYLSHGGGPMPLLNDPSHKHMIEFMKKLPAQLKRPEAIVVISAHWEEDVATLLTNKAPGLYYDYYGFPESTYALDYPLKTQMSTAQLITSLLSQQGIPYKYNSSRGYDHGVFIPLMLMYPKADIPVVQVSLLHNLDAKEHINLGKALSQLLEEPLLIIGSGFSFHNLRAFGFGEPPEEDPRNDQFQDWLIDTTTGDYDQTTREANLIAWQKAPSARYCHPREEHLLPLHVCAGIVQAKGKLIFDNTIAGKRSVAILW
ncbi:MULTISPECIES: class III extradiol ring-cleavage dioxygenase [unclassified Fusibacter]|uniref:DODA-type extradiol aromatic ring-opening family dioxygenase n=1 Tax=unclassified Fusibacter TaxID=2624464 RepID=UPI001010A3CB|nr:MULTISPECIES: class III extradiol ring-cleavage dioxygenase [unclassified Fusibacter]MCK8058428.1 dioxygenase [Fusibacter sp. A2]NPE22804.1 dioxygenase [Fusibacter sp. A1]RXV60359.1 dioxygenase [Fusibacter sp. A1]